MALLSLYLPCSFFVSSMRSQSFSADLTPSSSSASSTCTPVSSWKKECSSRSWMVYLQGHSSAWAGDWGALALPPSAPLLSPPLILVHADAALDDLLQLRDFHLVEAAGLQALGVTSVGVSCACPVTAPGSWGSGAEPGLCRATGLTDGPQAAAGPTDNPQAAMAPSSP